MQRWLGAVIVAAAMVCGCGMFDPVVLPPAPPVDCRGIPAATCGEIVKDARANAGEPGVVPVSIRAVCTRAACTQAEGEVQVDVRYSDGREDHFTMGWSSAMDGLGQPRGPAPIASLPVEPVCQGVPAEMCREQAFVGLANGGLAPEPLEVGSIVVTCTRVPCTEAAGDGDTTVTYVDGSTHAASWSYEGGTGADPLATD